VPVGRRERKKQLLRERILASAAELIRSQGAGPTTVEQIAERADISQTTFFNYFGSKAQLVDALLGKLVAGFDAMMAEPEFAEDATATGRVRALFDASAALTDRHQHLLRDLVGATIRTPNPATDSRFAYLRASLVRDLAAGQDAGHVRRDCPAEALAEAVLGLYVGVYLFWAAMPAPDYPVAERLRTSGRLAVELVRSGAATGDGALDDVVGGDHTGAGAVTGTGAAAEAGAAVR
jgi:AcrR family transcriptional regulator